MRRSDEKKEDEKEEDNYFNLFSPYSPLLSPFTNSESGYSSIILQE